MNFRNFSCNYKLAAFFCVYSKFDISNFQPIVRKRTLTEPGSRPRMPQRRPRGCDEILRKRHIYAPISVDPVTMGHQIERRNLESGKTQIQKSQNAFNQSKDPKKQKISLDPELMNQKNNVIHWDQRWCRQCINKEERIVQSSLPSGEITQFL